MRWTLLTVGLGVVMSWSVLSIVHGQESSVSVEAYGFDLSCATSVAEGSTLVCTLSNTTDADAPWPVVGIVHLSSDTDRALVVGSLIDVEFGTLVGGPDVESDVWWIGDVVVGYSRFDWDGEATASSETETTDSRTVNIAVNDDSAWEEAEAFYVSLAPNGSRGVGFLYDNRAEIAIPQSDSKSTDATLSGLVVSAGDTPTVLSSPVMTSVDVSVGYSVTELTVTPTASYQPSSITVSGAGRALSIDSGEESWAIPLAIGANTVTITVVAENGSASQAYTVTATRSVLAGGGNVTVSAGPFSLVCPAVVKEGDALSCTLRNTSASVEDLPVVAVLHSSVDSSRALIAEDPVIPESSPAYSQDVLLSTRSMNDIYNFGHGELFSGGSHEIYTTYGYQKVDLDGTAAASASITLNIETVSDLNLESSEIFYVALAESEYTGLADLVDNRVPIVLEEQEFSFTVAARAGGFRASATAFGGVQSLDLRSILNSASASEKGR